MADEAADRAADASIPRPYRCILSSLHPERQRLRRCDCTMNYLRGFFSLYGRINRIQYAMVMLVGYDLGIYAGFANLIVVICVLFAAMAKRFHDIARSGFSSLLVCIPVAGMSDT
jgi:uncharacterized membrane protein YhaH (DUF805 family)